MTQLLTSTGNTDPKSQSQNTSSSSESVLADCPTSQQLISWDTAEAQSSPLCLYCGSNEILLNKNTETNLISLFSYFVLISYKKHM